MQALRIRALVSPTRFCNQDLSVHQDHWHCPRSKVIRDLLVGFVSKLLYVSVRFHDFVTCFGFCLQTARRRNWPHSVKCMVFCACFFAFILQVKIRELDCIPQTSLRPCISYNLQELISFMANRGVSATHSLQSQKMEGLYGHRLNDSCTRLHSSRWAGGPSCRRMCGMVVA